MRTISLLLLSALTCAAEPFQLMSGSARHNDYKIRYETRLEPDGDRTAVKGLGGGIRIKDGRFYRTVRLKPKKVYFGYEIAVEALPDDRYEVRIAPLPQDVLDLESSRLDEEWTAARLPAYPEPQTIRNSDVIAIDLMENPETGQRIVDYLIVGSDALRHETVEGPARDFTPEDAWIRIMQPLVKVDGEVIPPTRNFKGGVSGPLAWIYTPTLGRYLLSLAPRGEHGFQLGGEVRGATIRIEAGGSTIELECSERITEEGGAYRLYVLHQPGFRPEKGADASFRMGSTGHVETLLQ